VKHPVPRLGPIDDLIEATMQRAGTWAAAAPAPERPRATADPAVDERLTAQLKRGVAALLDKKADKLVVLNLQGLTTISDYFVLATAGSNRQAQALADAVEMAQPAPWKATSLSTSPSRSRKTVSRSPQRGL